MRKPWVWYSTGWYVYAECKSKKMGWKTTIQYNTDSTVSSPEVFE